MVILRKDGQVVYNLMDSLGIVSLIEEKDEKNFLKALEITDKDERYSEVYGMSCDVGLWYCDKFEDCGKNLFFMLRLFPLIKKIIPVGELGEDWRNLI